MRDPERVCRETPTPRWRTSDARAARLVVFLRRLGLMLLLDLLLLLRWLLSWRRAGRLRTALLNLTASLPKSTADRRLKFGAHGDRPLRR